MIDTVSFSYICLDINHTDAMSYEEYEAMKKNKFSEYNGAFLIQVLQTCVNSKY